MNEEIDPKLLERALYNTLTRHGKYEKGRKSEEKFRKVTTITGL